MSDNSHILNLVFILDLSRKYLIIVSLHDYVFNQWCHLHFIVVATYREILHWLSDSLMRIMLYEIIRWARLLIVGLTWLWLRMVMVAILMRILRHALKSSMSLLLLLLEEGV